jgi:serine/threonine-protein kinase
MTAPRLVGRRLSTPARTTARDPNDISMPGEMHRQTGQRMAALGAAWATIWAIALILFVGIGPHVMSMPLMDLLWPLPGGAIAGTGLVVSLLVTYLANRLRDQSDLLALLGSGYLIITCFLYGLLEFWVPQFTLPNPVWIGLCIVVYASIVPSSPSATLGSSLVAATMAPMALLVTGLRGVDIHATLFQYTLAFLPNYLCAGLAVIPAKIIRKLGQQVKQARELGSYRLEEVLGKGGMGEVYRASHHLLARPAAVKLIRQDFLAGSGGSTRVALERFRREARAAASLRSPHTINLYDFGVAEDGTFFLVMEFLDGLDFERLIERFGPIEPARAVHLLTQACASLEEAHRNGLIHRDIKPGNIFTCRLGLEVDFVKVLDFGLVKEEGKSGRDQTMLTMPNATTGTPAFIAPEMVLGNPADYRVDIYALGCVAYWLVTGQLVFEAPSAIAMMYKHANEAPVPPSHRTEIPLPKEFDEAVLACLAKRPEDRPQSAAELADRLRASLPRQDWTSERAQRWWDRHRPPNTVDEECEACDMTMVPAMTPKPGMATPVEA